MIHDSDLSDTHFDRRRFVFSSAGALTAAGLGTLGWPAETWADGRPLPAPKPIPGVTDLSGFGLVPPYDFIHIFAPGPEGIVLPFTQVPLEGLNTEPSAITDFHGATAIAYMVGEATGSDGNTYNLETDIRAMAGRFVAVDGTTREGSFALI